MKINFNQLIVCFFMAVLVSSCASTPQKIEATFPYSKGAGALNTDKQQAAKLLLGSWQHISSSKKDGRQGLVGRIDGYNFSENGRVKLINTMQGHEIDGNYTLADNQTLEINFNNPVNNKPVTHTLTFFVTEYDGSHRLEMLAGSNILSFIPSSRLTCNELLYSGIWNFESTKWILFTREGTYSYFDESKNRSGLYGYYSLWKNSKGEEWISRAQFVPGFGNIGFAIGEIKIDGDILYLRSYWRNKDNPVIDTEHRKVAFEDVEDKPWWQEIQPRKTGFDARCGE